MSVFHVKSEKPITNRVNIEGFIPFLFRYSFPVISLISGLLLIGEINGVFNYFSPTNLSTKLDDRVTHPEKIEFISY